MTDEYRDDDMSMWFFFGIVLVVLIATAGCRSWDTGRGAVSRPLPDLRPVRVVPSVTQQPPTLHMHSIPGHPDMAAMHGDQVIEWVLHLHRLRQFQRRALGYDPAPAAVLIPMPMAPAVAPVLPDPETDTLELRRPGSRWYLYGRIAPR